MFAAGFSTGIFRVFDIEKTSILSEGKFHDAPITCIQFSKNGKFLITGDANSFYSIFDEEKNYSLIKTLERKTKLFYIIYKLIYKYVKFAF